jgi:hypothetical protein
MHHTTHIMQKNLASPVNLIVVIAQLSCLWSILEC